MKITALINGERTCIQVVKRGETVYIRRCAKTMFEPTERQMEGPKCVVCGKKVKDWKTLKHSVTWDGLK